MRLGFIPLWAISTVTGDPAKDGQVQVFLTLPRLFPKVKNFVR